MSILKKIPLWLRVLNIAFGLLLIILTVYVIINPEIAILTLILFLSFVLLISGVARFLNGLFDEHLSKKIRLLNIVMGIVLIGIGIGVLILPDLGTNILIFMLAMALLLQGITRITIGGSDIYLAGWFRVFLISLGVLSILFSFLVIFFPDLGATTLVFLLGWGFLISGIGRIATGFSGYVLVENEALFQ